MTRGRFRLPAIITSGSAAMAVPLLLGTPAPAAAAGVPSVGVVQSGVSPGTTLVNSPFFAGYEVVVTAGSATTSTARFTVPKLDCTSAGRAIAAVAGVEVNKYATFSAAAVAVECYKGAAVYFPELTIKGTEYFYQKSPAYAGNVIELSTRVTKTGTTVTVKDVTRRVTKTKKGAGASASAAYMGDSGSASIGVPKFGTITFSGCKVDGATLASKKPTKYQRATSKGVLQISTDSVAASGTKFATHFRHS